MYKRFVGLSFEADVTTLVKMSVKQDRTVVPKSVFPLFVPLEVYRKRECKRSGYAGAKYYILTLKITDNILVLRRAAEIIDFSDEYLLGKSRNGRGYNLDWPEVSKRYNGLLTNLSQEELSKLPEDDIYEWIFSMPNNLSIWDTRSLNLVIEPVKNSRVICR